MEYEMKDTTYFYSTNIQADIEKNMVKLTFQEKQMVDFVIQDVYFTFPDDKTQVTNIYSKFDPLSQYLNLHFTVRNKGTADSVAEAIVTLYVEVDGEYRRYNEFLTEPSPSADNVSISALKKGEQQKTSIQIQSGSIQPGERKLKLVLTTADAKTQYNANNEVIIEVLAQSEVAPAASIQE